MDSPTKTPRSSTGNAGPTRLPLATLLSHALVAFTIEFDNEFEHQMPHRTTNHGSSSGSRRGPWLVSLVMYSNCMKFVDEKGVTVGELVRLARTHTKLSGMQPWGYIVVAPDPADLRPKPPARDWVIRATPNGQRAREVWEPLFGAIEKRWHDRFGKKEIVQLRQSLAALAGQIDLPLPDCLPILGYGLYSRLPDPNPRAPLARDEHEDLSRLDLPALLSRVLLAFALEFERESDLSLAICSNVLRILDEEGVRARDLPRLSGVSKESLSMALGILRKARLAVVQSDATAKATKVVRLTPRGREAQDAYSRLLGDIETRWQERFGDAAIGNLRKALEQLVGEPTAPMSPLFRGLEPYPDGWRAAVPKPETLPHFPMVLHRGGYPDGS